MWDMIRVPCHAFADPNLGGAELKALGAVLAEIARAPDGVCLTTNADMAESVGLPVGSFIRSLARLESGGYVVRTTSPVHVAQLGRTVEVRSITLPPSAKGGA